MTRRLLKYLGRYERQIAVTIFYLSLIAFLVILGGIWKVPDKPTALLGAFIILKDGYDALKEIYEEETEKE